MDMTALAVTSTTKSDSSLSFETFVEVVKLANIIANACDIDAEILASDYPELQDSSGFLKLSSEKLASIPQLKEEWLNQTPEQSGYLYCSVYVAARLVL